MLRTQTYLNKITQVCQEIRHMKNSNKYIAVRNPTAWADGTTHEVVPDKKTNKIFNPGIYNQGNSQLPEDTYGACGLGCKLSSGNSTANRSCTHSNLGHHDASNHAPNS